MRNTLIVLVTMILFLGCGGDSIGEKDERFIATTNSSTNVDIEFINSVGLHGSAFDIALSDNGKFAYIASGNLGLQVLDVSNPKNPKLINVYDTDDYVNHVEVIDNVAYVSYIAQPWGYHQEVETNTKYIYLSDQSLHINSLDGENQNSYYLDNPYAIAVSREYIFVANGIDGMTVLKTKNNTVSKLVTQ